jgi:cation transport ATPase-like protein/uncharacterized protein DUF1918
LALVKRLVCIEDLGDVDVLFTDKTGTLTEGSLRFMRSAGPDGIADDQPLLLGLLCNEAVVENGTAAGGNPLDVALWESPAAKRQSSALEHWHRLATLPFDHERRLVSVLVEDDRGNRMIISKGAPEGLLARCSEVPGHDPRDTRRRIRGGQPRPPAAPPGRQVRVAQPPPTRRTDSGEAHFGRRCGARTGNRPMTSRPRTDGASDGPNASGRAARRAGGSLWIDLLQEDGCWRRVMTADIGDEVVVASPQRGQTGRVGTIVGMCTARGSPLYVVHWLAGDYDAVVLPGLARDIDVLHKAHAGLKADSRCQTER